MWKAAKTRAERRGIEFNIGEEDIIIPDVCPLLNIPLSFGTKEDYNNSPSLDRIDNTKGYIKGNIWVISKKANTMKNSASLEELYTFCANILRYSPSYTKNESIDKEVRDKIYELTESLGAGVGPYIKQLVRYISMVEIENELDFR